MADTQVKDETAAASIAATDRFYIVKDPTGTPLDRYGTPAQMLTYIKTGLPGVLGCVIDGGGSAITTGVKGDLVVPYNCTITSVTALADQSGSIIVDIWKDSYANFPPVDSPDSITASAPVTISSASKSQDSTLTGWTTSLSAGDVLRFNVDSNPATSITRVTIALAVSRA